MGVRITSSPTRVETRSPLRASQSAERRLRARSGAAPPSPRPSPSRACPSELDGWIAARGMHTRDLFSKEFCASGDLTPAELETVMRKALIFFAPSEMRALIAMLDEDGNGLIDLRELEVVIVSMPSWNPLPFVTAPCRRPSRAPPPPRATSVANAARAAAAAREGGAHTRRHARTGRAQTSLPHSPHLSHPPPPPSSLLLGWPFDPARSLARSLAPRLASRSRSAPRARSRAAPTRTRGCSTSTPSRPRATTRTRSRGRSPGRRSAGAPRHSRRRTRRAAASRRATRCARCSRR